MVAKKGVSPKKGRGKKPKPAVSKKMLGGFRTFLLVDEAKEKPTVDRMVPRLERMIRWGFDATKFKRSRAGAVTAGRAYLAKRRETAKSAFAYNSDVKVMSAFARFCSWDDLKFKYLPNPRIQKRALSPAQVRRLLDFYAEDEIEHKRNRALLMVALKTGMRASEIAAMNVSDLDPKRSRIYVRQPAKRGLRRWLPVERWFFSPKRPLAAWLAVRPVPKGKDAEALWTTAHKSGGGSYKPGHDPARRVSAEFLRTSLYNVGAQTGVHFNFNIARHTRGTELRKRGWDLLYIKEYLGHASVKSTEVYAEVDAEDVDAMMRKRPGRDFFNDDVDEDEE